MGGGSGMRGKGGQQGERDLLALQCLLPTSPSLLLSPILEATLSYYRTGFFTPHSPRSIALDLRKVPNHLSSVWSPRASDSLNC